MFVAVYEFEIREGSETEFRKAWLEVTKLIYKNCGSSGSRLHRSNKPNTFVAYAQWASRELWKKDFALNSQEFVSARQKMFDYIVTSKTVYELEVTDDYLQ